MTVRPIIVLAHGSQTRMGDLSTPKQLLLLDGQESIVARTLRQCRRIAADRPLVVVAPRTDAWREAGVWLRDRSGSAIGWVHLDGDAGQLVDGIHRLAYLWPDGATFLLGDVIFSNYALKLALEDEGSFIQIVGRTGVNRHTGRRWPELFAMDVPAADVAALTAILERIRARQPARAGLWQIYAELTGIVGTARSAWLIDPADWTDDLDLPEDLVHLPALARAALSDDQRETAVAEGG